MNTKTLIYGLAAVLFGSAFLFNPLVSSASTYPTYPYSYNSTGYNSAMSYPSSNSYMGPDGRMYYMMSGNSSYNSYNSYPYNSYGQTGYSSYPSTYSSYSSNQTCPPSFTLTTYNGLYGCFFFPNGYNNYNSYSYPYNYNNSYNSYYPYNNNYDNNYYNDNSDLNGNDASLRNFDVRDGNDSNDLQEDDNDSEVMEIRFDVEDGDVRLDRADIDFDFTGRSNAEDRPWNVFDRVRLEVDGDEIADMDTSDESDWDHQSGDVYRLRFDDLNDYIVREGDTANITVIVDTANNIDDVNNVSFELSVPDDGIRARDGNGDTEEIGDDGDSVRINFND